MGSQGEQSAGAKLLGIKGDLVDYVMVIVGFGLCRAWIVDRKSVV